MGSADVRFGSKADNTFSRDVRYTPKADELRGGWFVRIVPLAAIKSDRAVMSRQAARNSARFPDGPSDLANAIHLLEPFADFSSEAGEGVSIFVAL